MILTSLLIEACDLDRFHSSPFPEVVKGVDAYGYICGAVYRPILVVLFDIICSSIVYGAKKQ